ncbi:MAG TPA: VOC family protein [Acidimicrobiales bacterium]
MDAVPFHIGIATDDLAASMRDLSAAFGVTWTTPTAGPGVLRTVDGTPQPRPTSCVSREGPLHVDLMQGEPGTLWHVTGGPRLHHLAYWTDDVAGDVARLTGEGWHLEMTEPDTDGRPARFAYLIRDDGLRLELIDRDGRDAYLARLRE